MARITCLANIDPAKLALLRLVVRRAKAPLRIVDARIDVVELRALSPDLLICDIDSLETDPMEVLRQLRFVLSDCIIVVYTIETKRAWGRSCHMAGANGILSKNSNEDELITGVRAALFDGCFTDPRLSRLSLGPQRVSARAGVR